MRISTTLILACALSFAAVPAAAQSITGAIVRRVTDPSDAVIVGASVRTINAATAAVDAATTDNTGFYRIANLLPGEYFVEVEASGFQTARVSAQRLSLADNLRLDVKLELGETEFSVTVEDIASEVNTEDAQLGKVMRDLGVLPVLSTAGGRNVLFLVLTQPGVAPGPRGASLNGQRSRQNHVVVDGATTNIAATNFSVTGNNISPNAVDEFRVVTGPMKAEYGRNSGGVAIITTKSGGNQFHGMATEVFRNRALNAVPFFQKSAPGGTEKAFSNGLPPQARIQQPRLRRESGRTHSARQDLFLCLLSRFQAAPSRCQRGDRPQRRRAPGDRDLGHARSASAAWVAAARHRRQHPL